MVIVDCPWCTEPAVLEADDPAELVCEGCGVRAELAAEPAGHPVALAA